jgi:hypothetical protein
MPRHPPPFDRRPVGAPLYEIRVRGRISKSALARFKGLSAEAEPAETILRGTIDDQPALHRLFDRVQSLGLELVGVRRLDGRVRAAEPSRRG